MLVIKFTGMNKMPEYCDDCIYYEVRPHPYKGWTEACGFCMQSMDDDAPEDWIYDGNGRPKNCPLIEIPDEGEGGAE